MRIVSVREVRNEFAKLEAWLANGETIEIRRRGQPVGRLTPAVDEPPASPWAGVDILARQKELGCERMLTQEDLNLFESWNNEGQEG